MTSDSEQLWLTTFGRPPAADELDEARSFVGRLFVGTVRPRPPGNERVRVRRLANSGTSVALAMCRGVARPLNAAATLHADSQRKCRNTNDDHRPAECTVPIPPLHRPSPHARRARRRVRHGRPGVAAAATRRRPNVAARRTASRAAGQARDLPVHERRAVADRHVRSQAGTRAWEGQAAAGSRSEHHKLLGKPRPLGNAFPSPWKFAKYGECGMDVSDAVPARRQRAWTTSA